MLKPAKTFILTAFAIANLLALFAPSTAHAQVEHQLMRQMAVFPFAVPAEYQAAAEDAWWQAREEFAQTHRFLVASKQFLIKTDVFQPRRDLEPADAIILGKLLDAHGLVTFQMIERRLMMSVYDGTTGATIWRKGFTLHPSVPVGQQLPQLAKKMVDDFIANIPYQGFTIVDALIGQPVYNEGDIRLSQVDLGSATAAQVGDVVQWLKIMPTSVDPLFMGGSKTTIYAEGKIVKIEQGIATVEIQRASTLKDLKERSLVRIPKEAERLAKLYTLHENPRTTLTSELVAPEAAPMQQIAKERRPLATTLSIITSAAAFLLLAF